MSVCTALQCCKDGCKIRSRKLFSGKMSKVSIAETTSQRPLILAASEAIASGPRPDMSYICLPMFILCKIKYEICIFHSISIFYHFWLSPFKKKSIKNTWCLSRFKHFEWYVFLEKLLFIVFSNLSEMYIFKHYINIHKCVEPTMTQDTEHRTFNICISTFNKVYTLF